MDEALGEGRPQGKPLEGTKPGVAPSHKEKKKKTSRHVLEEAAGGLA